MNTDRPRGFVLYTQDYFGDRAVRLMPPDLRLVWVEAFFLMDQSPRRGFLLKENGAPYAAAELATLMNCSVELIAEAWEWIVREGIAGQNADGVLVCRRMVREEKKRKINQKNGKKGGNPSLAISTKERHVAVSVNRSVKPRARVPEPEPEPDLDPEPELNPKPDLELGIPEQGSLIEDSPPIQTSAARPRDLAADFFCARCKELTGTPYAIERGDMVQVARLRKLFGTANLKEPPDWQSATENYFASPLSQYSLADLANPKRYAVFKNSALDEFNKPITHENRSNGNGRRDESEAERRVRKTREASERLRARLDQSNSGNVPS